MFKVHSVDEARKKLIKKFNDYKLKIETIEISEAVGRVLAEDVYANINVPHFRRSTVDGYAVIAKDSFGASESLPIFLEVVDEVFMGKPAGVCISSDKTAYVPTGGMIPEGADAVLMVEYTEKLDENNIAVYKSVSPKENVINVGDDIKEGERVLARGQKLRAQDIGVLSSIGVNKVKVYKIPSFAVISTGDEIVGPIEEVGIGQIRDINTYTISAMVEDIGGKVTTKTVVRDDFEALRNVVEQAVEKEDFIIVSGGSSVGTKDVTSKVINSFGNPGVFVHGVSIKPGKPTILAKIGNKPVFGLPGQPVSAMIVFKVFVEYFIKDLLGVDQLESFIEAKSPINIHSAQGKETYQMVTIEKNVDDYIAHPVYGKSGMITLISKAKGYIKIDENQEGVKAGESVRVYLF